MRLGVAILLFLLSACSTSDVKSNKVSESKIARMKTIEWWDQGDHYHQKLTGMQCQKQIDTFSLVETKVIDSKGMTISCRYSNKLNATSVIFISYASGGMGKEYGRNSIEEYFNSEMSSLILQGKNVEFDELPKQSNGLPVANLGGVLQLKSMDISCGGAAIDMAVWGTEIGSYNVLLSTQHCRGNEAQIADFSHRLLIEAEEHLPNGMLYYGEGDPVEQGFKIVRPPK